MCFIAAAKYSTSLSSESCVFSPRLLPISLKSCNFLIYFLQLEIAKYSPFSVFINLVIHFLWTWSRQKVKTERHYMGDIFKCKLKSLSKNEKGKYPRQNNLAKVSLNSSWACMFHTYLCLLLLSTKKATPQKDL